MSQRPLPLQGLSGQEIPYNQIFDFCQAVVRYIFPREIWGSEHNESIILRSVKLFIKLKKYETLTMHTIMQGIRINDIQWAKLDRTDNSCLKFPVGDYKKRRGMNQDLVFWFFDSFLCTLLQSFFYVTETATSKHRLSYFDHILWQNHSTSEIQQMMTNSFTELTGFRPEMAVFSQTVRFIPKAEGMRPISKFSMQQQKMVSI